MTNTNIDFITLGADVGGKDAFSAMNPHVLALRGLLRQVDSRASGGVLKEIALVLRVDGSVQAWGKSGVDNISFQEGKAFVTADIFVPVEVWSAGDTPRIRRFLLAQVTCAIRLVVEDVNRHGVALDGTNLKEALENVEQRYLV